MPIYEYRCADCGFQKEYIQKMSDAPLTTCPECGKEAFGKNVYIWGDYPWLYAIAHLRNPTKYVTSFHIFGVPTGREEVINALEYNLPEFIIKPPSSIGYFNEFEKLLSENYHIIGKIENSDVFEKR